MNVLLALMYVGKEASAEKHMKEELYNTTEWHITLQGARFTRNTSDLNETLPLPEYNDEQLECRNTKAVNIS